MAVDDFINRFISGDYKRTTYGGYYILQFPTVDMFMEATAVEGWHIHLMKFPNTILYFREFRSKHESKHRSGGYLNGITRGMVPHNIEMKWLGKDIDITKAEEIEAIEGQSLIRMPDGFNLYVHHMGHMHYTYKETCAEANIEFFGSTPVTTVDFNGIKFLLIPENNVEPPNEEALAAEWVTSQPTPIFEKLKFNNVIGSDNAPFAVRFKTEKEAADKVVENIKEIYRDPSRYINGYLIYREGVNFFNRNGITYITGDWHLRNSRYPYGIRSNSNETPLSQFGYDPKKWYRIYSPRFNDELP